MINFSCTIIPVVVLDGIVTYTSAWFLDREIHQLVAVINPYSVFQLLIFKYSSLFTFYSVLV